MPNNKPDPQQFSGFPTPKQNWFKMPNEWIDICAEISSLAEIKVVQYVMRHTWGHQEYGILKHISLDEFMNGRRRQDGTRIDKGTGLTKKSVIAGLKSAVERGLLVEVVDDSDRARVKKYYALRMAEENDSDGNPIQQISPEKGTLPGGGEKVNADVYFLHPGVKKVYPRGKESIHRTEKETLERNLEKENNNNNMPMDSESDDVVVALSFQGIGKRVAEGLAQNYAENYIREKIAFLEFILAERPKDIKKPAAWLRKAIEDDYAAPDGFVSLAEWKRQEREAEERAAQIAREEEEFRARQKERRQEEEQAYAELIDKLHADYGTSAEAIDGWQQFVGDIEFKLTALNAALFQTAILLKIEGDEALIGVKSEHQLRQLSHPHLTTVFKREMVRILGREVTPKYVVLTELNELQSVGS